MSFKLNELLVSTQEAVAMSQHDWKLTIYRSHKYLKHFSDFQIPGWPTGPVKYMVYNGKTRTDCGTATQPSLRNMRPNSVARLVFTHFGFWKWHNVFLWANKSDMGNNVTKFKGYLAKEALLLSEDIFMREQIYLKWALKVKSMRPN